VSSSEVLGLVKVVDQPEVLGKFVDYDLVVRHRLVICDSLFDDHVSDLDNYW
jgi:hypothetical protein